jgi:alkanesulfonate monooxygenase
MIMASRNSDTSQRRPLDFLWFIPRHDDSPYLGSEGWQRPLDFSHFRQIAAALDTLGYGGVLLPTGEVAEDSWITATGLATITEHLKLLVPLHAGVDSPALAARQTAALDRLSDGRLLLNLVVGGNPAGILSAEERYAQAGEFLQAWRGLLSGQAADFNGRYYRVKEGELGLATLQAPYPPVYFGATSDAGHDLAVDHVDLQLGWAEPVADVAARIAKARRRAAARGRTLRFGLRLHLIVRETQDAAWAAAKKQIDRVSEARAASAESHFLEESDAIDQQRAAESRRLHRDRFTTPHALWAGVNLVRSASGTILVGDPATVATRLQEYRNAGVDTIIGSGHPTLEEAHCVAELLFPVLGRAADGDDTVHAVPTPAVIRETVGKSSVGRQDGARLQVVS